MADPAEDKTEANMGSLITFTPDVDLEWELGLELELVFTPETS